MELDCPRCRVGRLEEIEIDGTLIDRCKVCGGLWFDAGELVQVSGHMEAVKELEGIVPGEEAFLKCPRCENTTLRMQHICEGQKGDCKIFRCPSCLGSWIDRGVLRSSEDAHIAQNTRECFSRMLQGK